MSAQSAAAPANKSRRWLRLRPPKWLLTSTPQSVRQDFMAGLTGAVVVLPQGVAFAMIAGLPPQYGLYCAIVPAVIAALFGSSHHLISGPTTAISIVVFATLSPIAEPGSQQYVALALTLAFMTGVIQFGLGISRLGGLINFVSHSAVVGFTSGAAILIAVSQLKSLLGITLEGDAHSFVHVLVQIFAQIDQTNFYVLGVGLFTLVVALVIRLWRRSWPNMLIAMILSGGATYWFGWEAEGVKLIGAIPSQLPPISHPTFSFDHVRALSNGALAISLLGLIEAVSIARSVALKSGQTIDGNKEFIGQGLSNMAGSFFSAYPASGSFTRSGVNYDAGAKTPLSAVFAATSLALIVLAVAPLASHLPTAAMAGVILLVAYNLIDFHEIRKIAQTTRPGAIVMGVTFASTLFLELEFAIYAGVMLSLMFYLNRTSHPKVVARVPDPKSPWRMFVTDPALQECPQLKILRIDGSLYFGSVAHVEQILKDYAEQPGAQKNALVVCSGINFTDLSGAEMLEREAQRRRKRGGGLFLYDVKEQVYEMIKRSGSLSAIQQDHVFCSKSQAVENIVDRFLDKAQCAACPHQVFLECPSSLKSRQQEEERLRSSEAAMLEDSSQRESAAHSASTQSESGEENPTASQPSAQSEAHHNSQSVTA
ncbi:SulP family inorganic anion transporter [Magnetofaba australis]|uniref:Putative sulfate transporter n=1 Tax=Magnetofaba australis IT-1 TaxID=1434232 RepID=A0A1Y2K604_9PROT|nr:SulP family inorganic anion transporter [Magnetofaba australis]OSM02544.1 putative sulfate transporter [Magnetofaba australis IT-1]